eukprot:5472-Heterococcus_DN1.PRE.1
MVTTWIGLSGSKAPFPGVGCCHKTASTEYNIASPTSKFAETQLTNSFALPRTRPNDMNQCTSSETVDGVICSRTTKREYEEGNPVSRYRITYYAALLHPTLRQGG